ncbi:DUF6350 family protein [Brachybacterium huguangmaarense]|uniref:DUF6350 family protein n=1 Tax=Brachybacterium huguangmaarense TaxID=1652028 RepID=A0ABY6G1N9_9MICO|nr:DUF6350 family protein [Brachybacterium huguangmaarense]UYG17027.1 DUF6350 family protein [Brachybacterium huguangmaarense]
MTANSPDRISSPCVMGAIAALTSLVIACALGVVPALAAELVAARSSFGALGAVLLGIDAFVLGHGGSLQLSDSPIEGTVHLAPLGLTVLFVLSAAASMRRMGRALSLVRTDGALRAGALRDVAATATAFVLVYAVGGGVLASIGRSPSVHPVVSTAVLGCALVAVVGAIAGILWSLRRRAAAGVPAVRILDLLPAPYDAAARGAAIALLGLAAVSTLTVVAALVLGFSRAGAIWEQLEPGIVGGIVLLLLQLALLPTFSLWALAALLGGHFTVGVGTAVSLGASEPGVLPAVPLLAVLPGPGHAPGYVWLLLLLPIAALAAGAIAVVREVAGSPLRVRAAAWGSYAVAVLVAVLLLLALAGGAIGTERLREIGPALASVTLPLLAMIVGTLGLAVLVLDSPVIGWVRSGVGGLRTRVERAEARERGTEPVSEDAAELHRQGGSHTASSGGTDPHEGRGERDTSGGAGGTGDAATTARAGAEPTGTTGTASDSDDAEPAGRARGAGSEHGEGVRNPAGRSSAR